MSRKKIDILRLLSHLLARIGITKKRFLHLSARIGITKVVVEGINTLFLISISKHTEWFLHLTWLGKPILQQPLDLWTIQETIWDVQPELLIECGTYLGGCAYFYAQLFDLIGEGKVISIDIDKQHNLSHPRIDFIIGPSLSTEVVRRVSDTVSLVKGPVMVILDSKHTKDHVRQELEIYSRFVTTSSFILVQDGVIDTLPIFREHRPGPLPAIKDFLIDHPEFVVEPERSEKFLITYHPMGWLRKTEGAFSTDSQD